MDKTYAELLQETLSKIYELKDLNNRDRGKALTIFIGERLNRELLLSSMNIFNLYKEIVNLDDESLLADLRKTPWYKKWLTYDQENSRLINLSKFSFRSLERFEKIEYLKDVARYDFKEVIEAESYSLYDTLKEENGIILFGFAAENILLNHGFFNNTDYQLYDIPDEYMDDQEICMYMCLLNKDNIDFIDKDTYEDSVLYDIVKDSIFASVYWYIRDSIEEDTRTRVR